MAALNSFSITTVDKIGISMESCLTDLSYIHIRFPALLQVTRYMCIYICYTCEFIVYTTAIIHKQLASRQ